VTQAAFAVTGSPVELERHGDVFLLRMRAGENRFNPSFLQAMGEALDSVEMAEGPKALVTTGTGKFYSNGLDLTWMMGEGRDEAGPMVEQLLALFARVLCFPAITVAALNGHAFAAGAMFGLAHDFRVMRSERGYFCIPEIDLQMPLHPGMTAIIQSRLPRQSAHEAIVSGRRYSAELALERGIVDEALAGPEVLPRALAIAGELAAKAHPVLRTLKEGMYPDTLAALARGFGAVPGGDAAAR